MYAKTKKLKLPLIKGETWELDIHDILFFEADESIALAHYYIEGTTEVMTRYVNMPLFSLAVNLEALGFYRTHKTCLVNLAKVNPYGKYPGAILEICNDLTVPLSRRKRLLFHNEYLKYNNTQNEMS